jgi:hypothetical protein
MGICLLKARIRGARILKEESREMKKCWELMALFHCIIPCNTISNFDLSKNTIHI